MTESIIQFLKKPKKQLEDNISQLEKKKNEKETIERILEKGKDRYYQLLSDAWGQIRKHPNEKIESILSKDMIIALLSYCDYNGIVFVNPNNPENYYFVDPEKMAVIIQKYGITYDIKNHIFTTTKSNMDNLIINIDDNKVVK